MLHPVNITYGTDPEGFFQQSGQVIGSEKVLPEQGLIAIHHYLPSVVLDGVQFELNPPAANSPVEIGTKLGVAFSLLKQHLIGTSITCCWDRIVEVSRTELDSLSYKARQLGCAPSLNIYGERPLKCNPKTYRKRSPGGHIHLGLDKTNIFSGNTDERQRLIPLLDIFVGNFCVLLDRDPGAAERRENYGRAGEFRLPKHGVEYRTPDNFWLRDYALMSFVFGMASLATSILVSTLTGTHLEDELVKIVNIKRVITAINRNDIRLAKRNVEDLRPWLAKNLPEKGFPLNPGTIGKFIEFGDAIETKGIQTFFPDDPMTHWTSNNRMEFNQFLMRL